jgi:hypothetical protein
MALSDKESFHLDEYKLIMDEIKTKLKNRLELSRWGVLGLAAIYSYIFSNFDKPFLPYLYLVPVGLSGLIWYLVRAELEMVATPGRYITEKIEPMLAAPPAGTPGAPGEGWATFLDRGSSLSPAAAKPRLPVWRWDPLPGWGAVFIGTALIALIAIIALARR